MLLYILVLRPFGLYGVVLWTFILGIPASFIVGLVPPIMQRKMRKNLSEESINKYANSYLFCYLFCTLVWSTWGGLVLYHPAARTRLFVYLTTPFTLGNVYGYFVIKRYGREFADPSVTQQLYGREIETQTD